MHMHAHKHITFVLSATFNQYCLIFLFLYKSLSFLLNIYLINKTLFFSFIPFDQPFLFCKKNILKINKNPHFDLNECPVHFILNLQSRELKKKQIDELTNS